LVKRTPTTRTRATRQPLPIEHPTPFRSVVMPAGPGWWPVALVGPGRWMVALVGPGRWVVALVGPGWQVVALVRWAWDRDGSRWRWSG
jgi:hypothetical protein